MQHWNWFLAADLQGKWIITDGHAEIVHETSGTFSASLRITPDTPIYHKIDACIAEDHRVKATVTSPGKNIQPFELTGYLFAGQTKSGVETKTMILTDGTTVIGLCFGPRSHQKNL